ncbi:heat repeat protein [Diplodia corticola]|uniref:Heat repeat protein n=1 Tax=Diplodia corticola TaxID=236234 RepID=A0A1J9S9D1_9PEZI|nr:heat repeat protein [Diplodia corticola]OJD36189.1 heat repeat protein [Diplodia corticola]
MAEDTPLQAPVSVDFLRKLSKDLHSYIPTDGAISGESIDKLSDLLNALVGTASIPYIPASQRAGACNPLCSLLEKCQASPDQRIRSLIWTNHIWTDLFDIFLERYDNAKPKSMRQVLLLLCTILQKDQTTTAHSVKDESVIRLFDVLFQEDDTSKVKPALIALSHFVQKDVITVDYTIAAFEQWSAVRGKSLQLFPGPGSVPKTFLYGIMSWANHQDTTPTAGNAVCTIMDHGRRQQAAHFAQDDANSPPIWVDPLESTIRRNPDAMLNFKSHVFPDLFRPILTDYLRFLEHLHLDNHIRLKPSPDGASKSSDDLEASLLFTSLQVGKDMGFVQEVDHRISKKIEIRGGVVLIPDRLLGRLLAHERAETRLAAFSLLTTSAAVTRPLTLGTFAILKRNLSYLHADTDANFRGEIMSLTMSLFERLRGSTGVMSRNLAKGQKTGEQSDTFELYHAHVEFIQWYLRFIASELHPIAAYQRHISALKALTVVMKSGLDPSVPHQALSRTAQGEVRFPFQMNVLTPLLVRELFDLVMDPFDDVRHAAAFLLKLGTNKTSELPQKPAKGPKMVPVLIGKPVDSTALVEHAFAAFLDRAEKAMLRSGRADHADGVARAYDLLFERRAEPLSPNSPANSVLSEWMKSRQGIVEHLISLLDETIGVASSNLSVAVNTYPMHGTLSALRYIFDQPAFYASMATMEGVELEHWKQLHNHVLDSLRSVWSCVRNILCVDAPEGHVPEDMEEEPDLTTKDILSYSWRGLKEASTLLRVIVTKAPFQLPSGSSILETTEFEGLGKLCFLQLAELRHRGAFATVAQTFAAFCLRCSRSSDPGIKKLLDVWYEETLRCIRDKGSMITRRSAGLPSLITGILSAAPESTLFARVIGDLKAEAVQEEQDKNIEGSHLPQVHALNCLKDVFTNTKLAFVSEPYVAEGLSLAASRLESKVWAIRNCGLMLFRALIDRLLGSGTTQHWKDTDRLKITRLSYAKYPNLLDIIVQLLTPKRQGGATELTNTALEGVFPAFQILQRARPPVERRTEIQQLVFGLTASSHWHVRDMAARTLAALLGPEERVEWVLALIEMPFQRQNALHGLLSAAKYLVKDMCDGDSKGLRDDLDLLAFALFEQYERLYERNICPLTKSAYLDIVTTIQKHHIVNGDRKAPLPLICETFGEGGDMLDHIASGAFLLFDRFAADHSHKNSGKSAGEALLRGAISLAAAQHLLLLSTRVTGEQQPPQAAHALVTDLFKHIAGRDPDTCRSTLESLTSTLSAPVLAATHAGSAAHACIAALLSAAATTSSDVEVAAAVRHAFAELLDRGLGLVLLPHGGTGTARAAVMHHLAPLMLGGESTGRLGAGSPSLHEAALRLLGRYIDAASGSSSGSSSSSSSSPTPTATATEAQRAGDGDIDVANHLDPDLNFLLPLFTTTLRSDLTEHQPFPTRRAAIAALDSLRGFWRRPRPRQRQQTGGGGGGGADDDDDDEPQQQQQRQRLALALVAYDALNDDDDEIRDAAARVATRVVVLGGQQQQRRRRDNTDASASASNGDDGDDEEDDDDDDCADGVPAVVPLAASAKVAAWLGRVVCLGGQGEEEEEEGGERSFLCGEAVWRLLEKESGSGSGRGDGRDDFCGGGGGGSAAGKGVVGRIGGGGGGGGGFAARLEEARTETAALFAREKQNLFLDPVREVGVWGDVLAGLGLAGGAVGEEVVRALEGWCVDGLRELKALAERERDGAMGWAGRGEVFLLGWRVVGAVRVVLGWKRRGRGKGEAGGRLERKKRVGRYRSSEIRRVLRETVDAWVEADVHGLWVMEAEEVLSESVVAKLVDVRSVVGAVVGEELTVR